MVATPVPAGRYRRPVPKSLTHKGDWLADDDLAAQAQANDYEHFLIAFGKKFLLTVITRMDRNADVFKAINDNEGFAADLKTMYGRDVYEALRSNCGQIQ